jgi:hypothetical protein
MTARIPGGCGGLVSELGLEFGDHPKQVVVNDARGHTLASRDFIVAAG